MAEPPVDVLIITALKDELDAVLAFVPSGQLAGTWARKRDRHGFPYHLRELVNANGEPLRVAAAVSGEMGESGAATRATALIDELSPEYLAMCGICAGKRGDTFLGDVIVADRVYSYDHGKLIVGEENESKLFHDIETYNLQKQWLMDVADFAQRFQQTWEGAQSRPPSKQSQRHWLLHALRAHEEEAAPPPVEQQERQTRCPGWKQIIAELVEERLIERSPGKLKLTKAGLDWAANDRLDHPDGPLRDPAFRVHLGPIASGKSVREDPELFSRLKRLSRKTLGVEMEAAAIGAVAQKFGRHSIVVKAVSDHADHEKDDAFRAFACRASAAFLIEFLRAQASSSKASRRDLPAGTALTPRYSDERTRHLSTQLEHARERKRQLEAVGADTAQINRELLELRRELREGGRLRAGDLLGGDRFLLLEAIGQGGFATVWKALDRKTQETVAIKVLHPNLAGSQEKHERFFRGARRMAELQHPAVVRVIEQYGEDDGYYYFIMEYVSGGNLRQAVLNGTVRPNQIVPIILRIGEALALAHSRGIVHRDIKPANILLNDRGEPLLTDFDLVGAADTTGGTRTGALGTVAYAAPECLEHPQRADPRSDIYSLGMTALFGLHEADLPFARLLGAREQFFRQLQYPEPLKQVLSRATSLEPGNRYADAGEFVQALQHTSRNSSPLPWGKKVVTVRGGKGEHGLIPALTIISHPMPHRMGERLLLSALAAGRAEAISRNFPDFMRPGGGVGGPLLDTFLSRQPLVFAPGEAGSIQLLRQNSNLVVVAGVPLTEPWEFSPDDLTEGVPISLADRIVLLLHWASPNTRGAADALGLVGNSVGLQHVRGDIEKVAGWDVPVLIHGEAGSGMELIARAIHQCSQRRDKVFVSVNMGAIPRELASAELFGATKGSFTGVVKDREGYFRAADGGTLFLDEVGEAPPEVQLMLLRVLETGELFPVGARTPIAVNVRLIAATDANLEQKIQEGSFKAPLLHRLADHEIRVPPLRERREDIGLLFHHFAREELESIGQELPPRTDDSPQEPWLPASLAMTLVRYAWPGNIRQLRNLTRQLIIGSREYPSLRMDPRLENELKAALMPRPGRPAPVSGLIDS